MDVNMFANLLTGDNDALVDTLMNKHETQQTMEIEAYLQTLLFILLKNNLTTMEEFEDFNKAYKKKIEEKTRELYKKELEELMKTDKDDAA